MTEDEPVFSFEFFPPRTPEGERQLEEALAMLTPLEPDFCSVTYGAGGSTREGTLEITRTVREQHGIEGMAHLSCVGETAEGLDAIVEQVREAGIENIMVLRGDPPRGEKEFQPYPGGLTSATDLIAFIRERLGDDVTLGAACFPEVHPEAESAEADLDYLKTKVEAGADFLVTQLFFENELYFDFVEKARAIGIEVPIVPGIIPIASYEQIVRFCGICDASIPERLAAEMEKLGGDVEAETKLGVAYAARQCEELLAAGAPGVHFFTINRGAPSRAVLQALRVARPWDRAQAGAGAV